MSPRGRRAALPPDGTASRPTVRVPGTLLVEHRDKLGQIARYDFATLPCSGPMKESLAALFAARCTRAGGWESHDSSKHYWYNTRSFAVWMSEQHPDITDLDALSAGVWKQWRLSRPLNSMGYRQTVTVGGLLRHYAGLNASALDAISQRTRPVEAKEQSFTPEEFTQITTAARRMFRAAHLRITENAALLAHWRAGEVPQGGDAWLVGEALDCIARTGTAPHYVGASGHRRTYYRYVRPLGGENAMFTWRRLFPNLHEMIALAVLITAEQGLNLSTVSGLAVPRPAPDPGEDGHPLYRLELHKARRGSGRQFETRNLADFGADSPGRLITQALEVTAFARACVREQAPDLDRLLVWRDAVGGRATPERVLRVGLFGFGVSKDAAIEWARIQGLAGSPFRRGRRTVNVRHRREPGQNSQDTHDSVYVLRDRSVQQGAVEGIAAGADAALEQARATVLVALLREAPDPADQPTATADCHDIEHSYFTAHGTGCRASFLLCLACPNARIHPGHHPRLALLQQSLEALRSVMEPARWASEWQDTHGRLEHLRASLGDPVWTRALGSVTSSDRDVITHLLQGDFDQ